MQADIIKSTETMITKLCHDLSGSLSAINNGLELLSDETPKEIQEKSSKLVCQTAKDAIAKLIFCRQAFGSSASTSGVSLGRIQEICDAYFAIRTIGIQWKLPIDEQFELRSVHAKILMVGLAIISDGLVKGGALTLEEKGADVRVVGTAEIIKFQDANRNILMEVSAENAPNEDLSAKNVAAYYLKMLLCNQGVTFGLNETSSQITLTLEGFSNSFR